MGIKEENTQRIKELENEFSDEKIAEIFHVDSYDKLKTDAEEIRARRKALAKDIIGIVVIALCVVVLAQFYSLKIVYERSMEDTLEAKDCVVVARHAYAFSGVRYGDIIVTGSHMTDEDGTPRDLVKRVIGTPGDVIEIKDGSVYRNGLKLGEPYVGSGGTNGELKPVTVPEGRYFVLGDNRQVSVDSRDARVGYIEEEQIQGKVIFLLLPVSRAGRVM